jgi:hypothetical protein
MYNWQLWTNFVKAAEELDLTLRSLDGGCVYIDVPEDVRNKFYVMCWTPLNKLPEIQHKTQRKSPLTDFDIKHLMDNFRQNHSDFHLEFGAKQYADGSMYWFPELNSYTTTPSKDEIVNAVRMMLDTDNFEIYKTMALLREEADFG